jgi:hypothetical protein
MDLGEVGWGDVDWIGLGKDRDKLRALVNAAMNLWVPENAGNVSSATQLVACPVVLSSI